MADATAWVDAWIATVARLRDGAGTADFEPFLATDVAVVTPMGDVRGIDAYVATMRGLLEAMGPQGRLVRASPVDEVGAWLRFRWRMEGLPACWTSRTEGTDVVCLGSDGRVELNLVFYD